MVLQALAIRVRAQEKVVDDGKGSNLAKKDSCFFGQGHNRLGWIRCRL